MTAKWRTQNGASAVEFALVLPLLLLLAFGIIEFSLALYDKAMISHASREGARAGVAFRIPPVTDEEIANVVDVYLGTSLISFGAAAVAATTVTRAGSDPGDELRVSVDYTYTFFLIPNFITDLTGGVHLVASTVMRME
jgi:Flp pilus assembly protein TadG